MVRNLIICKDQFEKFYYQLTFQAPQGYIPWLFPCKKGGKDPAPEAIIKKDKMSKGSWLHSSARMNKDECLKLINEGYNLGLGAMQDDILINIDIDNKKYQEQIPKNTLTTISRKRDGRHAFCWNINKDCKINIATNEDGELRANNQYVLIPGSYVEVDEKIKKELTKEALNDSLLGYYTIENAIPPRNINWEEIPQIFKDKQKENISLEIETKQRIEEEKEKKFIQREGKYTELFNLKISDIIGQIKKNQGHPLHSSDTNANFSMSKDGTLGHCWRHNVSINAIQFLCIEAGYSTCENAGTPHKGGTSKIKGDKIAIEIAYQEAIKNNLIKESKILKGITIGYARGGLKLDNYIDNVEQFYENQPFFYDKNCMFWLWNKKEYKYEPTDETDMMNLIDLELGFGGQTVTGKIRSNYLESFKRVGRKHIPKDMPLSWIQFKNKIIDIKTDAIYEVDHTYYAVNPIPWNIGLSNDTPTIDRLFEEWQGNNTKVLYEVLAYCLIRDYPIHTVITMIGSGRNGKSQYQKIIENLFGKQNLTSTELDVLIDNRFESAKLYKKLVCSMGETNFGMIQKTSLLKKLCGGDLIGYEFKNKMPFTDHNYAKIIINTNSLPPSGDTTDGFYRRWLIISWNNCFPEGKDIVNIIPELEYENLCFKLILVLKELLERGNFTNQGSIEERKQRYIMASNPISIFLSEKCIISDSSYCKAKDLYHAYLTYLNENKRRIVKRKEFNQILAEEGFQAEHKDKRNLQGDFENSYWIEGLSLKQNSPNSPKSPCFPTPGPYMGNYSQNQGEKGELGELNLDKYILGYEMVDLMISESSSGNVGIDTLISYGVSESDIERWKGEGLFFESPNGYLRKV